ncbi:MAG: transcription elongation factor GreA [Oscillospiraceae bacterium]|nr:transcription elongation factor GreA [Oscillospiraceae bacterium]MCI6972586.1 transcription elongation factor GreA [Clostridiales bacterium]MDY2909404.1 transcription elongation factor GreA [Oscillospiraceae bacterium]
MNDELTRKDIDKMKEELTYRRDKLMPELIEEVKRTRAFGDLSENFEYKEAKRQKNRNGSRIRYLENMIRSAHIIDSGSREENVVGLYDKVTVYMPDDDETQVIQVVTTVRTDPLKGLISRESPFGKAVLGKRTGDRVLVQVNDHCSYEVEIRSVEKSEDDGSAPILQY